MNTLPAVTNDRETTESGALSRPALSETEMKRLCAEALGIHVEVTSDGVYLLSGFETGPEFDPLKNDGQALAIMKNFRLGAYWLDKHRMWVVHGEHRPHNGESSDLNRAILECAAMAQAGRLSGTKGG